MIEVRDKENSCGTSWNQPKLGQNRIERIQRKLRELSEIKTECTNIETSSTKIRTITTKLAENIGRELSEILGTIAPK